MNFVQDMKKNILLRLLRIFLFFSVMDSSLPTSLKHVISNVEYYGPVLFMAGTTLLLLTTSLASIGTLLNIMFWLSICKFLFNDGYTFLPFTAIDVVTVYVFHEPSLLSSLQDNGLTGVMLKALVVKEVIFIIFVKSFPSRLSSTK